MSIELVYDRTAEDVEARNAKGLYRYTDMNRVQDAVIALRVRYKAAGYNPREYPLETWSENDIPRFSRVQNYISSVRAFEGIVPLSENVTLPASMDKLDYIGANNIEKFLALTGSAMDAIEGAWWFSDEVFAGEVDV